MPPVSGGTRVVLDGRGLDLDRLIRLADAAAVPVVPSEALERARRPWRTARHLAATGRPYTRGTGTLLPPRQVRANQLLAGGSGVQPDTEDRPLSADVTAGAELLPLLAEL